MATAADKDDAKFRSVTLNPDDVPWATNGIEAPSIFADVIRGAAVLGGIARLNLVEYKIDAQSDEIKAKHVGTIAVPAVQLRAWAEFLANLADTTGN